MFRCTKRLAFGMKWRGNSNAFNLIYTRGTKLDNIASNFVRKDPILQPKRFNGLGNFMNITGTQRIHFQIPVRNVKSESLSLNPAKTYILCRSFHLSESRRAAPILPVIGAFLARFSGPIAQLLKLMAVVAGR